MLIQAERGLSGKLSSSSEELEAFEFFDCGSSAWVFLQSGAYQIFETGGCLDCIWERENPAFNFLVGFLYVLRLKRWSSVDKSVNYDAKAPDVDLTSVTFGL